MNKKIRRINLFGGPGVGKSTISAYLFYDFYEALGRYQTEEARKMDDYVRRNIRSFGVRLDCCLDATLHNEIRMTVRRKLGW